MKQLDHAAFADATPPPTDGARGRDSLFLLANLRLAGTTRAVPVRVRNLSAGGLMAEMPEPIDANAGIEIEVRGLGWVAGRIAWQTEGRAGIAFERPVDPQRARKPVGTAAPAKPRAVGFRA